MQSNLLQRASSLSTTYCLQSCTGHTTQVRNHVKMYPWRRSRNSKECYLDNTLTPYTDRFNMNEFDKYKRQRKDWQKVIPKDKDNRFNAYKWNDAYKSDPKEAKETATSKLNRFKDSITSRGAARESIPYEPPQDVNERVLNLYKSCLLSSNLSEVESDTIEDLLNVNLNQKRTLKFNLISKCIDEFNHDLPGSYLNELETIGDVIEYFSTPVRGVDPYSALVSKASSLPENLSLIPEPDRYDRETDQFFQGYNALPGIVSKVPGLRASKKYPILNQDEFQWPDI